MGACKAAASCRHLSGLIGRLPPFGAPTFRQPSSCRRLPTVSLYSSVNACRTSSSAYGHQEQLVRSERPGAAKVFDRHQGLRPTPRSSRDTTARPSDSNQRNDSKRFISAGRDAPLHLSLRPSHVTREEDPNPSRKWMNGGSSGRAERVVALAPHPDPNNN